MCSQNELECESEENFYNGAKRPLYKVLFTFYQVHQGTVALHSLRITAPTNIINCHSAEQG